MANVRSGLSRQDVQAIVNQASELGVDPYSFGGLLELESNMRPNVWGGAGGKYRGLIQFGPGARSEVGLPDVEMTISEQMPYVGKYFSQRGFKPGMGETAMYRTVLVGNPGQSGTDSFGTNSDSAALRMMKGGDLYERAKSKMDAALGGESLIFSPSSAQAGTLQTDNSAVESGGLGGVIDALFPSSSVSTSQASKTQRKAPDRYAGSHLADIVPVLFGRDR